MWICLNNAFVSIVAHRSNPHLLLVRARRAGDLARALPGAVRVERETPDADYRWRTTVSRADVARAIAEQVRAIDYPNFKDSVEDDALHDAYTDVWRRMYQLQEPAEGDDLWWPPPTPGEAADLEEPEDKWPFPKS